MPNEKQSLTLRLTLGTGEKPHVCDVCGKGFSTSSSLNTHRRIHSGEKPHQCPVCGKRFTASSNLYYHRMTHIKVTRSFITSHLFNALALSWQATFERCLSRCFHRSARYKTDHSERRSSWLSVNADAI